MSIATYDDLQAAIARRMGRDDLTTVIPDFIGQTESDINAALARSPVLPMMAAATGTISDETLAAPADIVDVVYLEITDGSTVWEVPYYAPENVSQLQPLSSAFVNQVDNLFGTSSSPIRAYTREGSDFRFFPAPQQSYTYALKYWQKLPALSVSNTANWLLAAHPNAYLYGALAHASVDTWDDERVSGFSDAFDNAMADVIASYPTRTDSTPLMTEISPRHILAPNSWFNL